MRQREKYGRLSEADRVEIGDRIKNGQTHAEIAAAVRVFDQVDPTAVDTHRRTGSPGSKSFAAPPYGCRARGDLAGPDGGRLVPGDRQASGQGAVDDLARSCRQRLEENDTGPGGRSDGRPGRPGARRWRSSPGAPGCGGRWSVCSPSAGLRSRLPIAFGSIIPRIPRCACLTRRSTSRCTCRRGERSERNSRPACAPAGRDDDPRGTGPERGG